MICAHSKWYRNRLAGILEILSFYGNIAFPLSPVLVLGSSLYYAFKRYPFKISNGKKEK